MLYCRFLLTHLEDPALVASNWASQLRPKGHLIIEETESIRTRLPVFQSYLDLVDAMMRDNAGILYVGPIVDQV